MSGAGCKMMFKNEAFRKCDICKNNLTNKYSKSFLINQGSELTDLIKLQATKFDHANNLSKELFVKTLVILI